MFDISLLQSYIIIALSMSASPGPNMMYLISRSISQGSAAGFVSMLGVQTATIIFVALSAIGVSALIIAIPFAFEIMKFCGAFYLLYLAYQAIHPKTKSVFEVRHLDKDNAWKLYSMGFFTNILNPKAMILFISILPQFTNPKLGHLYSQFAALGAIQIAASLLINGMVILSAAKVASFLNQNPQWIKIQKWIMGSILGFVAIRILLENR